MESPVVHNFMIIDNEQRQVNGKIVHFLCYNFVAMDKIFQEIKNSEERLQTHIEDQEGRAGRCHGSTTRRKKISSPLEIKVSYFDW